MAEHFHVLTLAVRLYKLAVMHVVHAESLRVQSISLIQNKALPLHQYLNLHFFIKSLGSKERRYTTLCFLGFHTRVSVAT